MDWQWEYRLTRRSSQLSIEEKFESSNIDGSFYPRPFSRSIVEVKSDRVLSDDKALSPFYRGGGA